MIALLLLLAVIIGKLLVIAATLIGFGLLFAFLALAILNEASK